MNPGEEEIKDGSVRFGMIRLYQPEGQIIFQPAMLDKQFPKSTATSTTQSILPAPPVRRIF